jgi:hypothetical protein
MFGKYEKEHYLRVYQKDTQINIGDHSHATSQTKSIRRQLSRTILRKTKVGLCFEGDLGKMVEV